MSRYIDADELKLYLDICEYCDKCPHKERNCMYTCTLPDGLTSEWERIIDEQPTADMVGVVRCKDCEHFAYSEELNKLHQCDDLGYCDFFDLRSDNCYCNFAEDKSDPNEIYFTEVRELVHGKWLIDRDGHYYCSRCFAKARWNYDRSMQYRTNYCPDCGADMDGAE